MKSNSPNPVDGDVQALIEKEMDAFEKWFLSYRTDWDKESIYRVNYKNGPGYSSAYVQAMWMGWNAHKDSTTPPAQLLRPIILDKGVKRNVISAMGAEDALWISRSSVISLLHSLGYEVKS